MPGCTPIAAGRDLLSVLSAQAAVDEDRLPENMVMRLVTPNEEVPNANRDPLIMSLFLMVVLGLQSCIVGSLTAAVGPAAEKEKTAQGGAVGLFVALLFLVGAAFVMAKPRLALFFFLVAALFAEAAGATTTFTDLKFWGIVAFALAVMSWLGAREKRRKPTASVEG